MSTYPAAIQGIKRDGDFLNSAILCTRIILQLLLFLSISILYQFAH